MTQTNHAIYQMKKQASLGNKEMELGQPVQMKIHQCTTYRKVLSWLHFNNEPRVQNKQQMKDQQSYVSVFVAYLTIPSIIVLWQDIGKINFRFSKNKPLSVYQFGFQKNDCIDQLFQLFIAYKTFLMLILPLKLGVMTLKLLGNIRHQGLIFKPLMVGV